MTNYETWLRTFRPGSRVEREWLAALLRQAVADAERDAVAAGTRSAYVLGWLLSHAQVSDDESIDLLHRCAP